MKTILAGGSPVCYYDSPPHILHISFVLKYASVQKDQTSPSSKLTSVQPKVFLSFLSYHGSLTFSLSFVRLVLNAQFDINKLDSVHIITLSVKKTMGSCI